MKNFFSKILLISFFYLTYSFEVVSFQLNYYNKKESISSSLYTKMKIGEPQSIINTYISSELQLYSMFEVLYKLDENELSSYYNLTLSKTFQNISCLEMKFITSNKDIHAKEKFILDLYNTETNQYRAIEVNDMDFVLGVKLYTSISGVYFMNIGFPLMHSQSIRDKFDFVTQLKQKNIISSYNWFIYFEKDKNKKEDEIMNLSNIDNIQAFLIIGGQPHEYKKNEFYESQIISEYSDAYKWTIGYNDIYTYIGNKKISTYEEIVEIYLDNIFIYASPFYTNLVKREYFDKYDSCGIEKDEDIKYYCQKSESFTIDDLKSFPPLYLEHKKFNFTFELTYQDLFIENDGKYWFLPIANKKDNWLIGFSFLKKYHFSFNQDSKIVNFYNPNLPKEEEEKDDKEKEKEEEKEKEKEKEKEDEQKEKEKEEEQKENKDKNNGNSNTEDNNKNNNESLSIQTIVLIVVIIGVVFIVIGIIIGLFIFKKLNKKKRANELDDKYEYAIGENENENIN